MKPRHPLLRRAIRIAFVVFLVVAAGLLVRAARAIDWNSVAAAIAGYEGRTLMIAAARTLLS